MPHCVDAVVVPVPTARLEEYRRFSEQSGHVWKEYGALQCWECADDDVKPGKLTPFPQSLQLRPDATVVFSWILFESREQRDAVNAKVMADPRMKHMDPKTMPFDGLRMFWGGFKTIVEM